MLANYHASSVPIFKNHDKTREGAQSPCLEQTQTGRQLSVKNGISTNIPAQNEVISNFPILTAKSDQSTSLMVCSIEDFKHTKSNHVDSDEDDDDNNDDGDGDNDEESEGAADESN